MHMFRHSACNKCLFYMPVLSCRPSSQKSRFMGFQGSGGKFTTKITTSWWPSYQYIIVPEKNKFSLLRMVDMLSLSLGIFVTCCLSQRIHILHLMLMTLRDTNIIFGSPYQMFLILLIEDLRSFLDWILLGSSWMATNFVGLFRVIGALIIVWPKTVI